MDGRVQLPVIDFLKKRFEADYVDVVTEAGPVRLLGDQPTRRGVQAIIDRVETSVMNHESRGIAVAAHHDCEGNPLDKAKQLEQLDTSVKLLAKWFRGARVIGLWVDEKWQVTEVV
jgi:hypothetical protein